MPDPRQGLFETLLVRAGRPVELEAHVRRLARSLHAIYGVLPPPGIPEQVLAGAAGLSLGRLRVTVAPDARGRFAATVRATPIEPAVLFPERPSDLASLAVPGGLGAHKWADRRGLDEPRRALPLIVDADGAVLEASRSNLFLVVAGALVTPAADGRLLPGVARRRVLDVAAQAGVPTCETRVTVADVHRADEAFLTNSLRGIEPVRSLDGRAHWQGWPTARGLARRLERLWAHAPVEEASPCP